MINMVLSRSIKARRLQGAGWRAHWRRPDHARGSGVQREQGVRLQPGEEDSRQGVQQHAGGVQHQSTYYTF